MYKLCDVFTQRGRDFSFVIFYQAVDFEIILKNSLKEIFTVILNHSNIHHRREVLCQESDINNHYFESASICSQVQQLIGSHAGC